MNESIAMLIKIGIVVIAFVPSICIHELAHGFAAYKLGDPTAKNAGRITLNPAKHIDPFGTVLLPASMILISSLTGGIGFVFGYAKPVPYNPNYFKNKKQGEIIVGLSGPAANILLALIGASICWLCGYLVPVSYLVATYVFQFGYALCSTNLCLAFFNLIPLPPLDGSSILALFLPYKYMNTYYEIQRYSFWIFIIIVCVVPYLTNIDIIGWYLNATAGNLLKLLIL